MSVAEIGDRYEVQGNDGVAPPFHREAVIAIPGAAISNASATKIVGNVELGKALLEYLERDPPWCNLSPREIEGGSFRLAVKHKKKQ